MISASNIETKARCAELAAASARAAAYGAHFSAALGQEDTYFAVKTGRLKLRVVEERPAQGERRAYAELIRYRRPDTDGARISEYQIETVDEPDAVLERLRAEHGIRVVVTKQRELWLVSSTRIHLDRVDALGAYVEIETVADGRLTDDLWAEHRRIAAALDVAAEDCVAGSYADLVEASRRATL